MGANDRSRGEVAGGCASVSAHLVVGPGAASVRRRVGASAWSALEVLVGSGRLVDGAVVVDFSVRRLAGMLGVAKGTAHRALGTLREAGLIAAEQSRAVNGRFGPGHYLVVIPADVLTVVGASAAYTEPTPVARSRPARSHGPRGSSDSTQLALLDAD